ncbi:uncharacterized protein LOC125679440 isoform X2 [Ostrea edulis]|uniref:uncharacterized protein LOC125679440 isoform X2 n=1 Tax=Ostrea edulis TaxID=37623 RepID=UPI0020946053|nr:uncharacterized protein LOC125679440 isoform X2 [Ostrea edulis]
MAKLEKRGFFRSWSLPSNQVKKGKRRDFEARDGETPEASPEEVHEVLSKIKTLATNAKKSFKKKKVYHYYCEELIDRWIPDLKRMLRITSREERRLRERAEAQEENLRGETRRDLRNFSRDFDRKRKGDEEITALKQKHEDEIFRQRKDYEENISKIKREHEEAMKRLKDEKEKLLTRLSQAAGNKLRENNPAVSDLSDPNRPLKLSEKISELYDNEWTDAMEILEKDREEKKAVETLLHIIVKCYELCEKFSKHQLSSLEDACSGEINSVKEQDSIATGKAKGIRKDIAPWMISNSNLYQVICQELEQLIGEDDARKCKPFIQKCVQYCWYLSVQDPGMYLAVWTSGTKFDNNEMKSFTKIGQYVDFTVWPALYLHRDGPLLSKAIVQGTNHATV